MSKKVETGQAGLAAKRALWEKRVAEWERSGQTQKAFCSERDLVLSTFQWWRTRARRRDSAKVAVKPFLPIALHPVSVVEVELRSRTRMRFEGEAALQAVAQLMARVK